MFSLLVHCHPGEEDLLIAAMWEMGTAGIADEPGGFRAFFEDWVPFAELQTRLGGALIVKRQEEDTDWGQVSRDAFPPVEVGERFFLVPPWAQDKTPAGRIRLEINPGMACGTGYHPCTQMCLAAMERFLRPGASVLDVGSGSGILSEAAALLGAKRVIGCDIDPEAVTVAKDRVTTAVFVGSVDAVQSSSMDLIVANISAAAVEELWDEFERVGKRGSVLIVSGFRSGELAPIEGLSGQIEQDGWSCWVWGEEGA